MLETLRQAIRSRRRGGPEIRQVGGEETVVDDYWGETTVAAPKFRNAKQSEENLEWRFDQYPLFREFSGLWGDHGGETILDYGCGPGNDVTGFALYTGAEKIIGLDVSAKALDLARRRLALHDVPEERVELIDTSDSETTIPLPDASVDHLNSQGVLHHTSDPEALLRELHRVMKPGATGCIMVYNRDSAWFHLFVAYDLMTVQDAFPGMDIDEVFKRTTDGPDCPISRAYAPADWVAMCERAGFEAEFVGGYMSLTDLSTVETWLEQARSDERLGREHREFLAELEVDEHGHPLYRGKHAGLGATYRIRRPA
jgi:SAM-dependent methyltransferase